MSAPTPASQVPGPRTAGVARRSRPRLRTGGALVLLLTVVGIPSLPQYLLGASSMAAGTLISCSIALVIAACLYAARPTAWRQRLRGMLLPGLAVAAHFVVASVLSPADIGRFAASWVLLLVFLAGTQAIAVLLFELPAARLHRVLRWTMCALLLSAVGGLIGVAPPASQPYDKPVFPYTEPSHFALSFLPFLLYFAVSTKGWQRFALIFTGLLLALSLQNMTLLVGALVVALVCELRLMLVVIPLTALIASPYLDISYFVSRLDFSAETDNLSSLVFVQGWQLIEESLFRTSFWGLGFQQLGVRGTDVPFAQLIYALMDTYVNVNDGGFTLSKLVSEFGLFGIALALGHLALAWNAARALRSHALGRRPIPVAHRLAAAAVVGFTVELFVRGTGYFTASSLLYVAALYAIRAQSPRPAQPRSVPTPATRQQDDGMASPAR